MTRLPAPISGVLTLTLLAHISSCSLAPIYEAPDTGLPPRYATSAPEAAPDASTESGSGPRALDDWRSFHSDPRLVRLIELALANNHDGFP